MESSLSVGWAFTFLALFIQNYIIRSEYTRLQKNEQKECQKLQSRLLLVLHYILIVMLEILGYKP